MFRVYGHYTFLILSVRGLSSCVKFDVCKRQILTSEDGFRAERVKYVSVVDGAPTQTLYQRLNNV